MGLYRARYERENGVGMMVLALSGPRLAECQGIKRHYNQGGDDETDKGTPRAYESGNDGENAILSARRIGTLYRVDQN